MATKSKASLPPRAEPSPVIAPEVAPLHSREAAHRPKAGIRPSPRSMVVGLGLVLRQRNPGHRKSPE